MKNRAFAHGSQAIILESHKASGSRKGPPAGNLRPFFILKTGVTTMIKRLSEIMTGFVVWIMAVPCLADWTPLIASNDFTGIRTDLGTAVAGIITLVLIVFGVMMMIRTMIGR